MVPICNPIQYTVICNFPNTFLLQDNVIEIKYRFAITFNSNVQNQIRGGPSHFQKEGGPIPG